MPREQNKCAWLAIGHSEKCGGNCINNYCGFYNVYFRRSTITHKPCRGCGVGTKVDC